jgi:hypothetical protein
MEVTLNGEIEDVQTRKKTPAMTSGFGIAWY